MYNTYITNVSTSYSARGYKQLVWKR